MYVSPVAPVAIMLTRSLPARTPLWSLENNSIYLKKQQFLCEEMGLLRTCSMHWRRFFPFQVIGFFFLKAGKVTHKENRCQEGPEFGVGLDTELLQLALQELGWGRENGHRRLLSC